MSGYFYTWDKVVVLLDEEKEFEKQTSGRLSAIEAKLDMLITNCVPCKARIDDAIDAAHEALQSAKSAHHRLDEHKKELKEYKESVRWTIGISITISSAVVGFITWLITWLIRR